MRGRLHSASKPRHETELGVGLARGDELRHLVELRKVSRLAAAIAAGWHRDVGQVESKIADGNKPAAVLVAHAASRGICPRMKPSIAPSSFAIRSRRFASSR